MRRLFILCFLCGVMVTPCLSRGVKREAKRFGLQGDREGREDTAILGVVVNIRPTVSFAVRTEPAGEQSDTRMTFRSPMASAPGEPDDPQDPASRVAVSFYATGGPDTYLATNRVVLVVSTNIEGWGILCQASPLSGENGQILGSQVYARSDYTDSEALADEGAGPGFVSLGTARVVGMGSASEQIELPLDFKLLTEAGDKAGNYTGTIVFSYMPAP
jgi:hypothetical protein